jgi:hypothetical protein
MRWRVSEAVIVGREIEVRGFLWLPKTINNERRWLERASWIEVGVVKYVRNGLYEKSMQPASWID